MSAATVMIELEPSLLAKLDGFVAGHLFHSRSDAVATAVREKIERVESHAQFFAECQKLDPVEEQAFAEEWFDGERPASKQDGIVMVEIPIKAGQALDGCGRLPERRA